ncbi:MAG: glycosyl transferase, partial [Rhodospirillales bacterium]|nr:glycosyl transferase [Acetobacter sp.]
ADEGVASGDAQLQRVVVYSLGTLTVVGLMAAAALAFGLWSARGLPPAPDVGDLLAHRGVGDYTLSMSHFFDLTGASFSALRLPAALACAAFALGPGTAFLLRRRGRSFGSMLVLAGASAVFLIAAHLALVRFGSMLSSQNFAQLIQKTEANHQADDGSEVLLFGDQAYGSSLPFYLGRPVKLVDGRSTSMLFGSTFPDAPPVFVSHEQMVKEWGKGERKFLFVPLEHRDDVDRLLGARQVVLAESSGKALVTDRPLQQRSTPGPGRTPGK